MKKACARPFPLTLKAIPSGIRSGSQHLGGRAHLAVEGAGREEGGEAVSDDSSLKIIIV
jgi:hypothetical protein